MLCELDSLYDNFFVTWMTITALTIVLVFAMSGTIFRLLYWRPTYETWLYKSQPKYPPAEMVRDEVIQTLKGVAAATFAPTLSLWLAKHGHSQAYCGIGEEHGGISWLIATFFITWIGSDFVEFYYHRLGHVTDWGWSVHVYHHIFWNPSPFAVIADEPFDQFVRALPLLVIPLLMPANINLVFFVFGVFFYAYGTFLHSGFELPPPFDTHNSLFLNTGYHHFLHHAKSIKNKPYHTGFMTQLWDWMFGTLHSGPCKCAACQRSQGLRTKEAYDKITKPDYSVLARPSFWLETFNKKSQYTKKKTELTQ
eukprot:TRINITY_DN9905_c0_g1_i1.p1 TRINITY_DN9905_c0_g1~~TRINITY_DN9905_c0_g1_i1.p1  ORF type:complete len:323 (-),score=23.19 TRINITY_DN9905_c0_g1_i1:73-999(-)